MADEKESRELTAAEKKRLVYFNELIERMEADGYTKKDLTSTPAKTNLLGTVYGLLLAVPFVVLYLFIVIRMGNFSESLPRGPWSFFILLAVMLVLIVVHELIHGFTWGLFAKDRFKSIEFGIIWKSLNPYCTCRDPLTKGQYLLGAIMPCIVLGVIPCIISLFTGNLGWIFIGVIMVASAGGDLLICSMILKSKDSASSVYLDHPTEIGLMRFDKQK